MKQAVTDTELLDWAQKYLLELREIISDREFLMIWINDEGVLIKTYGETIRDCIKNAIDGNTYF